MVGLVSHPIETEAAAAIVEKRREKRKVKLMGGELDMR
jgi:hypothetical protein